MYFNTKSYLKSTRNYTVEHALSLSLGLVSFFVWIYASVNGFMKSQLEGDGDSSVGCSYAC